MKVNSKIAENKNWFLAILSGILLTLAFPKPGLWFLGWCALVPLLAAIRGYSFSRAFKTGFLAGLVHYLTLLSWLVYTMQTYGRLPAYLAIPLLFLLSAYMALYIGFFSALISRWNPELPIGYLLAVPVVWVFLEYLRGVLFTGFPWSFLGYSQYKQLHIIQISDIFGVYGVSFLLAFSNSIFFLITDQVLCQKKQQPGYLKNTAAGIFLFILLLTFSWSYGKWRVESIEKSLSTAPVRRITVVQGNIDQAIKWDPSFQEATTQKYVDLSLSEKIHQPDLVVWPETATPFYFLYDVPLSKMIFEVVADMGSDFLIGSPSFKSGKDRIEYFNSAYLIQADTSFFEKYDKVHLVPYGEYVPFKRWLPFLGKMVEHVGDFKPGEKGSTISWNGKRLGVQICFEIIFPGLSRAMVVNGADILINITNDAWFGKTSAPYQHFSMAIFRAIENRRFLVRAANTGISGFVDPRGVVIEQSGLFEDTVMTTTISMINETSVYTRFGDIFSILCGVVFVIAIFRNGFQSIRHHKIIKKRSK